MNLIITPTSIEQASGSKGPYRKVKVGSDTYYAFPPVIPLTVAINTGAAYQIEWEQSGAYRHIKGIGIAPTQEAFPTSTPVAPGAPQPMYRWSDGTYHPNVQPVPAGVDFSKLGMAGPAPAFAPAPVQESRYMGKTSAEWDAKDKAERTSIEAQKAADITKDLLIAKVCTVDSDVVLKMWAWLDKSLTNGLPVETVELIAARPKPEKKSTKAAV